MSELCLLTGASGFIGGHLAQRLVSQGTPVRALVRASSDTRKLDQIGVQLAVGDLADAASVLRAAEGCRYVVHCGALVSDWATVREIRQVNVAGTRNVMRAASAARAQRLVHISSTDIYGHPAGREIDETHLPTRFSNWYSRTKLEAERELRPAAGTDSPETVILRPATIYGPGSVGVVGEIAKAIRSGQMILIARGRALAGLCFIDNLIDAILLALSHGRAPREAFNVIDGVDVTWRRFLADLAAGLHCAAPRLSLPYPLARGLGLTMEQSYRTLRTATGLHAAPLLSRQAVEVMGRDQSFSHAKISRRLGWEPRVDYRAGLKRTLDWLLAEPETPS